jgi:Tol biopolymer transport system component
VPAWREPPRLLEIGLPEDAPVWLWWWRPLPALAVSPDGRQVVYVADRGLGTQLYLREFESSSVAPLPGTQEARHPFFSSDGTRVAYFSETGLMTIELASRRVQKVVDVMPEGSGGSWADNGYLYYTPSPSSGIFRVAADGGTPEPVTQLDTSRQERAHLWPDVLPGSGILLYNGLDDAGLTTSRLIAESLTTGEKVVLAEGGVSARYFPSKGGNGGQVVFADMGKLLTLPFDPVRLRALGPPRTILEGIRTESTGAAQFALARDGTLVYVPGTAELGDRSLVWVEDDGRIAPLAAPKRNYHEPRLSPDGRRIAMEINDAGRSDVWIYDIERSTLSRLTFEGNNFAPVWSPDGRRIAFVSDRQGQFTLMTKPFDDSAAARVLVSSDQSILPSSWSPDGRYLAYYARHSERQLDVWMWSEETGESSLFMATSSSELKPMFSPDGRWIAFSSDRSGRREVYLAPFPEAEPVTQISLDGGRSPRWNLSGTALFYRQGEDVLSVPFRSRAVIELGEPEPLPGAGGEGPGDGLTLSRMAALSAPGEMMTVKGESRVEPSAAPEIRFDPPPPGQRQTWRRRYLFQRRGETYAVELRDGVRPEAGTPRIIYRGSEDSTGMDPEYDIAAPDDRLLMVTGSKEQPVVDKLAVALGFLEAAAGS